MPAEPGLNIAALSRRTGVPAHTLRKWEQRYGALTPTRTAGGQRRYSEVDVARVRWLRDRLGEGYRIAQAAALLATPARAPAETVEDLRAALLAAVERTEAEGTERLLDQTLALHPLETALEDVVRPVLEEVGRRWEAGTISVAQEHLLSAAVRGRIVRLLADPRPDVRGRAVLACAPDERHELGLLMLATLLAADGWNVVYLGAETPVEEALATAAAVEADATCLSVTMRQHRAALAEGVARGVAAGRDVIIGGPAADRELARSMKARYGGETARLALPELARLGR